ncbi:hypothetical protein AB4Y45_32445 [Paraburkholderia sp. EG287A]|uniref:hypothetical protein n=1 Tax=Paraburkholderia sp. EG287A TaxID=3237012 RepID=UPI0034D386CE
MNWLFIVVPVFIFVWFVLLADDKPRPAARNGTPRPPHTRSALHAYEFPQVVRDVFRRENPHLSTGQQDLAFKGLKEYFMLMLLEQQSGRRASLGMPSVLVDDAWHAFVLCTRQYEEFCLKFFGQMVHHMPDPSSRPGVLDENSDFSVGTENTWNAYRRGVRKFPAYFSAVADMPLLFGLDTYIGLSTGWLWTPSALNALDRQAALVASATGDTGSDCSGGSCTSFTPVNAWPDSPAASSGRAYSSDHDTSSTSHGGSDSHHGGGHSCSGHSCGGHSCGGSSCGSSCGSGCGGGD